MWCSSYQILKRTKFWVLPSGDMEQQEDQFFEGNGSSSRCMHMMIGYLKMHHPYHTPEVKKKKKKKKKEREREEEISVK